MSYSTSFWLSGSFIVFWLVFGRTVYQKLTQALDARTLQIKAKFKEVDNLKLQAQQRLIEAQKYQQNIKEWQAQHEKTLNEELQKISQKNAMFLEQYRKGAEVQLHNKAQQMQDKLYQEVVDKVFEKISQNFLNRS